MDVAALKEHLPEDLTLEDEALGRLLDAAREAVEDRIGPIGPITEYFAVRPRHKYVRLARRAMTINLVNEATVDLEAEGYYLHSSGRLLGRVDTTWGTPVSVTYTPVPDLARREAAMISLVKLDITHNPGLVRQEIEGWAETYRIAGDIGNTYTQAREDILMSLREPLAGVW